MFPAKISVCRIGCRAARGTTRSSSVQASGQDVITDFAPGSDVLEFRDGIFADAAAALAAATASGTNTLITIDASNSVLVQNVAVANLHLADFHIT